MQEGYSLQHFNTSGLPENLSLDTLFIELPGTEYMMINVNHSDFLTPSSNFGDTFSHTLLMVGTTKSGKSARKSIVFNFVNRQSNPPYIEEKQLFENSPLNVTIDFSADIVIHPDIKFYSNTIRDDEGNQPILSYKP